MKSISLVVFQTNITNLVTLLLVLVDDCIFPSVFHLHHSTSYKSDIFLPSCKYILLDLFLSVQLSLQHMQPHSEKEYKNDFGTCEKLFLLSISICTFECI